MDICAGTDFIQSGFSKFIFSGPYKQINYLRAVCITFETMQLLNVSGILVETVALTSSYLERDVVIDFYLPKNVPDPATMSLLLINDGQNMEELGLEAILTTLYAEKEIKPLFCAAIHTGIERKAEYGIAAEADYLGRGAKAGLYTGFIL